MVGIFDVIYSTFVNVFLRRFFTFFKIFLNVFFTSMAGDVIVVLHANDLQEFSAGPGVSSPACT